MPDLDFQVESVEAVPFAVAPLLNFKLRVDNSNLASGFKPSHCVVKFRLNRRAGITTAKNRKKCSTFSASLSVGDKR